MNDGLTEGEIFDDKVIVRLGESGRQVGDVPAEVFVEGEVKVDLFGKKVFHAAGEQVQGCERGVEPGDGDEWAGAETEVLGDGEVRDVDAMTPTQLESADGDVAVQLVLELGAETVYDELARQEPGQQGVGNDCCQEEIKTQASDSSIFRDSHKVMRF